MVSAEYVFRCLLFLAQVSRGLQVQRKVRKRWNESMTMYIDREIVSPAIQPNLSIHVNLRKLWRVDGGGTWVWRGRRLSSARVREKATRLDFMFQILL